MFDARARVALPWSCVHLCRITIHYGKRFSVVAKSKIGPSSKSHQVPCNTLSAAIRGPRYCALDGWGFLQGAAHSATVPMVKNRRGTWLTGLRRESRTLPQIGGFQVAQEFASFARPA